MNRETFYVLKLEDGRFYRGLENPSFAAISAWQWDKYQEAEDVHDRISIPTTIMKLTITVTKARKPT